ncbi:hypothetical protein [Ileibacterium valens]|uniref:hypothetical protein n=1 Tax=Ileibacterium valens TaxID=1862668 RepID=UPI0027322B9A|nr:hypothetical protein [Ileibacterium valens]
MTYKYISLLMKAELVSKEITKKLDSLNGCVPARALRGLNSAEEELEDLLSEIKAYKANGFEGDWA